MTRRPLLVAIAFSLAVLVISSAGERATAAETQLGSYLLSRSYVVLGHLNSVTFAPERMAYVDGISGSRVLPAWRIQVLVDSALIAPTRAPDTLAFLCAGRPLVRTRGQRTLAYAAPLKHDQNRLWGNALIVADNQVFYEDLGRQSAQSGNINYEAGQRERVDHQASESWKGFVGRGLSDSLFVSPFRLAGVPIDSLEDDLSLRMAQNPIQALKSAAEIVIWNKTRHLGSTLVRGNKATMTIVVSTLFPRRNRDVVRGITLSIPLTCVQDLPDSSSYLIPLVSPGAPAADLDLCLQGLRVFGGKLASIPETYVQDLDKRLILASQPKATDK